MRIYFYRGHGIWSALIRWFTRSKYAHIAVAFSDGTVYESVPGKGVRKTKLTSTDGVTPFIFKPGVRFDEEAARKFCESELGTPYDLWGCICFVLGIKQRYSESAYFCSEFTGDAASSGGAPLFERVESFKLSPDNCSWSPIITVDAARKFQWDHAGRYA